MYFGRHILFWFGFLFLFFFFEESDVWTFCVSSSSMSQWTYIKFDIWQLLQCLYLGGSLVVLVIATISLPQYCLQFLCRFTWGFTEVLMHNKMYKLYQQSLKTLLRYDSEILCSEKIVLFREEDIIVSCHKHVKGKNYFPMKFSFTLKRVRK